MRVTLRQLAVFEAVARLGSVSAAAAEVSLSQSAASLALKGLEQSLGVALFQRQRKKLIVNMNGRRLQPYAKSMLTMVQEIETHGATGPDPARLLRIGASGTIGNYLMSRIVARFLKRHPQIRVRLTIASEADVIDQVEQLVLDLGFVESLSMRPNLLVEPWLEDRLVIVASPKHWAASRRITIAQLEGERWCLQPLTSMGRHAFTQPYGELVRSGSIAFECDSIEAIKRSIQAGVGIGCLSRLAVGSELGCGSLVALRVRDFAIERRFNVILRRDVYRGGAATDFANEARQMFARR
ncbi:MAG: LysR substrate-binding domain-containing protein [Lautropia sp.]